MAKKEHLLSYHKQFIVNPGTEKETSYINLALVEEIPQHKGSEYYIVSSLSEKGEALWGIINEHGNIVVPIQYKDIDSHFWSCGNPDNYVLPVVNKDGQANLLNTDFQEIFPKSYSSIDLCRRGICILHENNSVGLGNVVTGEEIIPPRYRHIEQLRNPDLFRFNPLEDADSNQWGIVTATGDLLQYPRFISYRLGEQWYDYNLLRANDSWRQYVILDWHGKEVYLSGSQYCERYRHLHYGKSVNSFVFYEKNNSRRCPAKFVVINSAQGTNDHQVLEYPFYYNDRAYDSGANLERHVRKIIKRNKLNEIVDYHYDCWW